MMDKNEARIYFENQLSTKFDERTVAQLWRIIIEDLSIDRNDLEKEKLNRIIDRLKANEPIQYITGVAWFMDLDLSVNPSVLIPRPETEELVHYTIKKLQKLFPNKAPNSPLETSSELVESGEGVENENLRILDIGTGSGCIPLAIKKKIQESKVYGLDISSDALQVAKNNGQRLDLDVKWMQGDILSENDIPFDLIFDVIISNPPYITKAEQHVMDTSVLEYEPKIALFTGDDDPLLFYKSIIPFAKKHLKKTGFIALECNEYYCSEVATLYGQEIGRTEIITDIQGKNRFVFSFFSN